MEILRSLFSVELREVSRCHCRSGSQILIPGLAKAYRKIISISSHGSAIRNHRTLPGAQLPANGTGKLVACREVGRRFAREKLQMACHNVAGTQGTDKSDDHDGNRESHASVNPVYTQSKIA